MMNRMNLNCFKAYDIRGRMPDELNEDIAYRIGRAFAEVEKPKTMIVGYDARETSPLFAEKVAKGLSDGGADVLNIGLCGTEEVYFSTFHFETDGGIMVTASHNPMDYNGMKLVRRDSKPVSGDTGLNDIKSVAEEGVFREPKRKGRIDNLNHREAFVRHLLGYVRQDRLKPLKLVVNAGNGAAGPALDALEPFLPFDFVKVCHEPDSSFPNGIPNPLLPENRQLTVEAVVKSGADFGIAWDGDFDRCFLFDETGAFIEGYYIVGLLAEAFLMDNPAEKIIYDPRLTWNSIDIIEKSGGIPVMSKTGHAFIKERMRAENAVYGGEMSAHHYFREFSYCDSGMIPWLLVAALVSSTGKKLSELVNDRIAKFPSSGEINRKVADADAVLTAVEDKYAAGGKLDRTDGLSVEYDNWRFNFRKSNTEPLLRLNVESRGDEALMKEKTDELLRFIDSN